MRRILFVAAVVLAAAACCVSGCGKADTNAVGAGYLVPVHPGDGAEIPFWNGFAVKFTYAPAFEVPAVEGAEKYRFTVASADDEWSFETEDRHSSLALIWDYVPVGDVCMTVEALDGNGAVLSTAMKRKFLRDFTFFDAEIHQPFRSFGETARYDLLAMHRMAYSQWWKDHITPEPNFRYNSYPCKIVGATIGVELLLAQLYPEKREESLQCARNAARFLIDQAQPADAPLAFFPPTYYNNAVMTSAARLSDNQGATMTMEACSVADAFLSLFRLTGERQYYDFALDIMRTYRKIQCQDGSFPIKVNYDTGEPLLNVCAMPHPVILTVARLNREFGVTEFDDMASAAEKWMAEGPVRSFDFTGQFEDVPVNGLHPYENLTYVAAAMYAEYLLYDLTEGIDHGVSLETALDMVRFCEDQFVHWDWLPDENGVRTLPWPAVCEQYKYQVPVDDAAATVSRAFLAAYHATGDRRWKAKAEALLATLTHVQHKLSGLIVTDWYEMTPEEGFSFWPNCAYKSINAMLLYEKYFGDGSCVSPSLTPSDSETLLTFLVAGGGA